MFRAVTFLLLILTANLAFAQTPPPGVPFDASKHANPILTFVELKDFKPATSDQTKKDAGIELLGISQSEGKQESLELADGRFLKNFSILGNRVDVTFYPVVKQKFKLKDGAELVLYSFKFPKSIIPPEALIAASLEKKKKPSEMRFGGEKPENLDIRGARALLFEKDGTTTVYWQENGIGHTATSSMPQKDLFEIIEDLL